MNCVYCKEEIHPLRLKALPHTKTCVNCSTTTPKKGMVVTYGEKDDTWNDIQIMDSKEYERVQKLNKQKSKFDENIDNN
jgi:hypothetical protein